jgi:thiamine pyrophosphokinase
MSSHHIVKDKQEPALIIANGEECSQELMGQLLEWQPTVVVLDGALDRILKYDIKVDVLLGDFDRLTNIEEKVAKQQPIEVVHTPDQNKTDLEKGIDYLIERGHKAANIIWATGLRADHSIANITNMVKFKEQINLVMWDNHSKIFPINKSFQKWYKKGTPISLIPVGEAGGIITSGLKYNLSDESLVMAKRMGNSNEAENDGIVKIEYSTGNLLLMECED